MLSRLVHHYCCGWSRSVAQPTDQHVTLLLHSDDTLDRYRYKDTITHDEWTMLINMMWAMVIWGGGPEEVLH